MFSATWPKEIQRIASTFCTKNVVHIKIGEDENTCTVKGLTVNADIRQEVWVVKDKMAKFGALKTLMTKITENNKVMKKIIIFCLRKCDVDQVENLMLNDWDLKAAVNQEAWGIHGDKL